MGGEVGGSVGIDVGACDVSTIWKGGGWAPEIWVPNGCHDDCNNMLQQRCLM